MLVSSVIKTKLYIFFTLWSSFDSQSKIKQLASYECVVSPSFSIRKQQDGNCKKKKKKKVCLKFHNKTSVTNGWHHLVLIFDTESILLHRQPLDLKRAH